MALPITPTYISIHALLAESDVHGIFQRGNGGQFLSTLSLRRATGDFGFDLVSGLNFYPRSPCGERRYDGRLCRGLHQISIHALLAESDVLQS